MADNYSVVSRKGYLSFFLGRGGGVTLYTKPVSVMELEYINSSLISYKNIDYQS